MRLAALLFALMIVGTGLALLGWLLAAGLWEPIHPFAGLLFAAVAGAVWLALARRLLGAEALRLHSRSAIALAVVARSLELLLWRLTGAYTSLGVMLLIFGSSGGLVFTVMLRLMHH
jgi:hypothetical protein